MKHLLPVFGPRLICDIAPDDLAAYQRRRLQSGAQDRTVNLELGELRKVMKANDAWLSFGNKYHGLRERKSVGKALTSDQEAALLAAAAKSDSACYTATVLALNTTMRSQEIKSLRWEQIDLVEREPVVSESKTDAGTGRLIPLNPTVFEALVRWASRRPSADPRHYVFPWCENRKVDPTRPTKGWRTAWRNDLKQAAFKCRFHDLRHTVITKLAEGRASDMTIMSIAGHVSKEMMERYSHIRTEAKRRALDAIAQAPTPSVFEDVVHQNVHQIEDGDSDAPRKPLN